MAILNPDHLFDLAEKLIVASPAGAPRQVDLRRAISSAYYGVFHATLISAADHFVGATKRTTTEYALVYRSINHRSLRTLGLQVIKPTLPANFVPYGPRNAFWPRHKGFCGGSRRVARKATLGRLRSSHSHQEFGRFIGSERRTERNSPL